MDQLEFIGQIERLLISEALPVFHQIEGKHKGPRYKYQYKPIEEFFRNRYLDTINKVDVDNYRRYRAADDLKASSINREHSVITRLFNAFKEWRDLKVVGPFNFEKLMLPEGNPGEQVSKADERAFTRNLVLTPMEVFRFCDYAHPRIRVIVIVTILTLLRRKNVEVLGKEHFNRALQQIQLTQSKTGVPLAIPAQQTIQIIIEGMSYQCQIDFTNYRRLMERAQRESGVKFWLTDLRRTGATQMLLDGVDLRTIQKYLGHTTLVMTERYLQPPVQNMVDAGKTIERRFETAIESLQFSVGQK